MLTLMNGKLPEGREVFLRYTYSSKADAFYGSAVRKIADSNNTEIMVYGCRGYLACSSWFLSKVV